MHSLELSPQSKSHIEALFALYEEQLAGRGSLWMETLVDELDLLEKRPFANPFLTSREEEIRRMIT